MHELRRKIGDKILIGIPAIEISLVRITDRKVLLGLSAPLGTRIESEIIPIPDSGGTYEDVTCGRGG